MSKVLDNARQHYRSQLGGQLKSIEVEEWGQTIYFKPAVTMAEQQKVIELSQQNKLSEALIETLMIRALDEDGKRLFNLGDRHVLMHEVDPNIIIRIVTIINQATEESKSLGN